MCGIAGFLDPSMTSEDGISRLSAMLKPIHHRGPDDEGTWYETPGIGLGHRRLAIVDLSPMGHQPMQSISGRFIIVFNGEIYNHKILRKNFLERNNFRGGSDTETLLSLIEEFGLIKALQLCVGMFAIAVWDRKEKKLYLARDRFGEKPLYFSQVQKKLFFASEIKAINVCEDGKRKIDALSVKNLLEKGYICQPNSIYENISQVEPGGVCEFSFNEFRIELKKQFFWDSGEISALAQKNTFKGSLNDAVEAVTDALRDSIGLQMQADVPLGAFLSGGIDSSLVVALMCAQSVRPVQTYSIGFHDSALDEASHAKAVAEYLQTQHTEWYVNASDILNLVPHLTDYYDEPLADPSQLPTLILAQLTKNDVTVALSGDGADEFFGGYPKYWKGEAISKIKGRGLIGGSAGFLSENIVSVLNSSLPSSIAKKIPWHRLDAISSVYSSPSSTVLADRLSAVNRHPYKYMNKELVLEVENQLKEKKDDCNIEFGNYARNAMMVDVNKYLPSNILVKVDRATMVHSLESRAPFLDHRVFELAQRMPNDYLFGVNQGKKILRLALKNLIPNNLIDRPKSGFTPPLGSWLRYELRAWARDVLNNSAAREVLNVEECYSLLDLHCETKFDFSARLWPMLSLASWIGKEKRI